MNSYHNVFPVDKKSAKIIFASGDINKICHTMVAVSFYEKDWRWAQNVCLELFNDANPEISGLASTCLGHIARIHQKLDKERVTEILRNRLNDDRIAGRIQDALDDIEMYIPS